MNALISVFEKEGLVPFAEQLVDLGFNLFSSGGTADNLSAAGLTVTKVGINILDHCVVTLVPQVHGGLLAKPGVHDKEMVKLDYSFFDLACVDLYPLKEAIAKGLSPEEVIKATDIGGPTMLRSATKGGRLVLCKPSQRQPFIDWVRSGKPNESFVRNMLAFAAEQFVADYIQASAGYRKQLMQGQMSALEMSTGSLLVSSLAG